jgi:uroporphyrinogen-III synthase
MENPSPLYIVCVSDQDPDLLALRGMGILRHADIIFYDPGPAAEVLRFSRPEASRIPLSGQSSKKAMGKGPVTDRMVEAVRAGKRVVRLLSGERVEGSETAAMEQFLLQEGIVWEMIPGATPGASMRSGPDSRWPLEGRRILVTRALEQSGPFAEILRERGARVVQVPTIRFEAPDSWNTIDRALDHLSRFQLTIFTSVNGVDFFFRRLNDRGKDIRELRSSVLAAIGPKTAEALRDRGLPVDLIPDSFVAEGLVEALPGGGFEDKEILIPRAQEARHFLIQELERRGAKVTVAPVYRTVRAEENRAFLLQTLETGGVDLVTFTASSTVRQLAELVGSDRFASLLSGVKIACIGPVTAETVRSRGLHPHVVAERYTIGDLAEAITSYFSTSGEPEQA